MDNNTQEFKISPEKSTLIMLIILISFFVFLALVAFVDLPNAPLASFFFLIVALGYGIIFLYRYYYLRPNIVAIMEWGVVLKFRLNREKRFLWNQILLVDARTSSLFGIRDGVILVQERKGYSISFESAEAIRKAYAKATGAMPLTIDEYRKANSS